jgi:hypothetical protein
MFARSCGLRRTRVEAFENTAMPIPMVANVANIVRFLIIIICENPVRLGGTRIEAAVADRGDQVRQ